jgi:hypothetical protein
LSKRRNNQERTGAPHQDAPAPPPPVLENNTQDIFSFINPTEFVDLPSKGELYPESHPLHGVDTLEIRHMTAKEEDILTSEALIKKGVALDRLLDSLIVEKKVKAADLLIGDKNAVLIAARITGFGPEYNVSVGCPACSATQDTDVDLSEIETKVTDGLPEDVVRLENGNYEITFPQYEGLAVEVRLLSGRDEHRIMQQREKRKKLKLPDANITDQLEAVIVRINDVTDAAMLKKFVDRCPTRISREIRSRYDNIVPDIDLSFDFSCDNCGHLEKVGMPLTAQFFWPK